MMIRIIVILVLAVTNVPALHASNWYASPNATSSGNGSITNPWSLSVVFSNYYAHTVRWTNTVVQPGDTVFLRGGTYVGCWNSALMGASNNPITVCSYPGEWAIFDSDTTNFITVLEVWGQYTWYRDFEVMNSATNRYPVRGIGVDAGQACGSVGLKFINLVVHDVGVGIGAWTPATHTEIYGCIIYNGGYETNAPDRGHCHAIYSQNNIGSTKLLRDNIMFNMFREGIQIYTQAGAINGYDMEGNVAFDNGSSSYGTNLSMNYYVGGGACADNITFNQNVAYNVPYCPPGSGQSIQMGCQSTNGSVTMTNNYLVGGGAVIEWWTNATCWSNTFVGAITATEVNPISGSNPYIWDYNTYIQQDPYVVAWGGTNTSLGQWQTNYGYGLHDTLIYQYYPTNNVIFIRTNVYETDRLTITVFNWLSNDVVNVNIGSALPQGANFHVQNVQNYFGLPVLTGTYTNQLISLPMTNLYCVPIIGIPSHTPIQTWPQFGVFILLPGTNAIDTLVPPANLRIVP